MTQSPGSAQGDHLALPAYSFMLRRDNYVTASGIVQQGEADIWGLIQGERECVSRYSVLHRSPSCFPYGSEQYRDQV